MQSKWFHLKENALILRKEGKSIREIEKHLKIPRSTLSGWFKVIILSEKQLIHLQNNRLDNLNIFRKLAVKWHNQQKEIRIEEAKNKALETLSKINYRNHNQLELALAMLYLGEGAKLETGLGMGNSDPLLLNFFISCLVNIYQINKNKIRCYLHLRADQNQNKMKRYWSKELNLPIKNFMTSSIDLRTIGKPTFPSYHGVCVINCGNIAIQRKLLFIGKMYCEKIISKWAVSSVGRASD